MTGAGRPTVVLALDGLSFRYLDAFDLPNFEALRSRGVEATLASTHPPWTASAWPSMYTGTSPDHHGVFSFFDFEGTAPPDADVVDRNDVRRPALWNYLTEAGLSTVALNLPVTAPAEPIEGVLIPGYLAPEDAPGHPPGVRRAVSAAVGERYRIYARTELADDPDEKLAGYVDLVDLRRRAAEHLLSTREWDLAVVQVQKTDAVFHNFDDEAAFERVYRAADDLVGSVLAAAGDANVVVCSDHGMSPNTGYIVHVNEVLREHGFVETTDARGAPSLGDRKRQWVVGDPGGPADDGSTPLAARAVSGVQRALAAVGVTPGDVYAASRRLGVAAPLQRLLPETSSVVGGVDWADSRAYCRLGSELGVRVNLAGRDPGGVVPRSAYREVRERVVEVLSGLRTPDGERAFEFVGPREHVYDGPHTGRAPDVLFRPARMNHGVVAGLVGRPFVPTDGHNHDFDGVFVAAGPDVADLDRDELSLPDVAPLVMALLGRPVPERMTGTVPPGLVDGPVERTDYGEVPFGTARDRDPDRDRVAERLEDLGYL